MTSLTTVPRPKTTANRVPGDEPDRFFLPSLESMDRAGPDESVASIVLDESDSDITLTRY